MDVDSLIYFDRCLFDFFYSLKTILLNINIYLKKKFASNLKIVKEIEREIARKLKIHIKFVHSTL